MYMYIFTHIYIGAGVALERLAQVHRQHRRHPRLCCVRFSVYVHIGRAQYKLVDAPVPETRDPERKNLNPEAVYTTCGSEEGSYLRLIYFCTTQL